MASTRRFENPWPAVVNECDIKLDITDGMPCPVNARRIQRRTTTEPGHSADELLFPNGPGRELVFNEQRKRQRLFIGPVLEMMRKMYHAHGLVSMARLRPRWYR